ncbi:MAG TPA: four helix bundle protein [Allocoleopsis sp.]
MERSKFEELQVYQLAEKLADKILHIVDEWNQFAKDTVGKQIVRSGDSAFLMRSLAPCSRIVGWALPNRT